LTIKVFNPFQWIKLTCEARADILAWKCFIESFNGKSMFLPDHWNRIFEFFMNGPHISRAITIGKSSSPWLSPTPADIPVHLLKV
jgi:hypothetical protein